MSLFVTGSVLVLLLSESQFTQAVEVAPNSLCSGLCDNHPNSDPSNQNSSWTLQDDVVCNDWEIAGANSSITGRKFKDCLLCESNSTTHDATSDENNVYWFLCQLTPLLSSYFKLTRF